MKNTILARLRLQSKKPSRSAPRPETSRDYVDNLPIPNDIVTRSKLLTPWHIKCLTDFDRNLPVNYRACPKVRLLDLVVVKHPDSTVRQTTINRLGNKHVDFAIIDQEGRIIFVLILDSLDEQPPSNLRTIRQRVITETLTQARIPLIITKSQQPLQIKKWVATYAPSF